MSKTKLQIRQLQARVGQLEELVAGSGQLSKLDAQTMNTFLQRIQLKLQTDNTLKQSVDQRVSRDRIAEPGHIGHHSLHDRALDCNIGSKAPSAVGVDSERVHGSPSGSGGASDTPTHADSLGDDSTPAGPTFSEARRGANPEQAIIEALKKSQIDAGILQIRLDQYRQSEDQ